MTKQDTIIYFYPGAKSSFVAKDIRLLSKQFDVREYSFNTSNKKMILWELLKQKVYILKSLFRASVFIIKFGGYWSLLPVMFARIFGKKSIIITGGTDCVAFPEISYGNFQNKALSLFTKLSFKNANVIVALHESMISSEYSYENLKFKSQGIKTHIPDIKTKFALINNGYDSKIWNKTKDKIPNTFITVAGGLGENRRRILKGIDIFVDAAKEFPEYSFIIIGGNKNDIDNLPANVTVKPKATQDELALFYSQAQFYLQLSMSEGFPNSLCEAMLCECVPIVSNVASMPYIIDDSGFILERKNLNLLKDTIKEALNSDTETLGKKARNRVATMFTEDKRSQKLIETIESVVKK